MSITSDNIGSFLVFLHICWSDWCILHLSEVEYLHFVWLAWPQVLATCKVHLYCSAVLTCSPWCHRCVLTKAHLCILLAASDRIPVCGPKILVSGRRVRRVNVLPYRHWWNLQTLTMMNRAFSYFCTLLFSTLFNVLNTKEIGFSSQEGMIWDMTAPTP
jgi:hypothetical protein